MPRGTDLEVLKASLPTEWKDVPVLSYSQLMQADRCGFAWYLNYFLKLKTKARKSALTKGSYGHELLESLYRSLMAGESPEFWEERRLPVVLNYLLDAVEYDDQSVDLAAAMKIVQRYAGTDLLSGHTPVGTEQYFFTMVTTPRGFQFVLQGYVDLITTDVRGQTWVWDHKFTGKMWTPVQLMMDSQLPIYQMLLRADGIPVHGLVINQLNSYAYKDMAAQPNDKLFKREFMFRSEVQLQNIWAEFMALAERVGRMMTGAEPIYRSLKKDCSMCDYNTACHDNMSGTPIEEAVEAFNEGAGARRSMPAGTGVDIILD